MTRDPFDRREKFCSRRDGGKKRKRLIIERHEMAYLDGASAGWGSRFGQKDTRLDRTPDQFFIPSALVKRIRTHEDVLKASWSDVGPEPEAPAEEIGHGPVRHLTPEEIERDYGHVNGKICVPPEKRWGAYVKCLVRECRRNKASAPDLNKLLDAPYSYPERVPLRVVEELEAALARAKGNITVGEGA